ncbi:hypothetical protein V8J36_13715 [Frigidibacter sp. MR17.14]|uniref:hypothetical protein n=1 Tax=Frigidibacter sp. MR17.14 TaxID=3126509 RepID=UPI003012AC57
MTITETRTPSIAATIAVHGARRVLLAAAIALLRGSGRRQLLVVPTHNDHMRRDIGLPPVHAPPPRPPVRPW